MSEEFRDEQLLSEAELKEISGGIEDLNKKLLVIGDLTQKQMKHYLILYMQKYHKSYAEALAAIREAYETGTLPPYSG